MRGIQTVVYFELTIQSNAAQHPLMSLCGQEISFEELTTRL